MNALDVCNYALSKISQRQILSLEDTKDSLALQCSTLYHPARREVLTTCRWTFATKSRFIYRDEISDPDEIPEPYTVAFRIPPRCLRILDVPLRKWTLSGRRIWACADAPERLQITYIDNIEDVEQFDPLFVDALACKLAEKLCLSVTGSSSMRSALTNEYNRIILPMAKHFNLIQHRSNDQHPLNDILNRSLFRS